MTRADRLAIGASVLLVQHRLDRRGRCRGCGRRWRRGCPVLRVLRFALDQPEHVLHPWWRDLVNQQ